MTGTGVDETIQTETAQGNSAADLIERVDFFRVDGFGRVDPSRRTELGQFPTPPSVARFMASLFVDVPMSTRLLDAGAGVGSLTAAVVADLINRNQRPSDMSVTAFEIDQRISEYLTTTVDLCGEACRKRGIEFSGTVRTDDFIRAAASMIGDEMFGSVGPAFNLAVLNPPYKKINSDSEHRRLLRHVGVETSNLYTAFLALVVMLLEPGGQLVAITPRSFCNGPYFRPFRQLFLRLMSIRRIHVFESRTKAFADDDVLQENVIFHAVKAEERPTSIVVSTSHGPDEEPEEWEVSPDDVIKPGDPQQFIHIIPDEFGSHVVDQISRLTNTLHDLRLCVSTGRVVDFRSRDFLRSEPGANTVPLIYPGHFDNGWISWPKPGTKKPNAIVADEDSDDWLVPGAAYVLVKRFSAKEEKRRIVAAVYDPDRIQADKVGFENHVNYFHQGGRGLPMHLAKGLTAFLNSTVVDDYFRQFNGHTQVNASDLRNLKYPSRCELEDLGAKIGDTFPLQNDLDELIEQGLLGMGKDSAAANAFRVRRRTDEALAVLKALGMPPEQQNDRSAWTLLALLDLKPRSKWSSARNPLVGITPIMGYIEQHYGKKYAANTRETIRRFTVHQFEQAGLVVKNPDEPRPVNSPDNVYQVETSTLELLQTVGTSDWEKNLEAYLLTRQTLQERYAAARVMHNIPVALPGGKTIELSPGGQNILIKEVIEKFCPYYTPGGDVLYVGDAGDKFPVWDRDALAKLGVIVDEHGKMPDVVVYYKAKNWLVLVEAVTSHGPVNPKRHHELRELFRGSKIGLVYVTAFLDRRGMSKYLPDISWETEVWCSDAPTHLIHFNGARFLGPYETVRIESR